MKKIIALLLAVCLMAALVACGETKPAETTETTAAETAETAEAAAPSLVGTWEYEGGGYTYTFNADGTGNYDVGSDMPFTYTDDGETVAITFEGSTAPMELKYTIEGSKLTVIDSLGSPVVYNKK